MSIPDDRGLTITDALAFWAQATPDTVAIASPDREPATYEALNEASARLAAMLRNLGLGRNDGIALIFPPGPDLGLALLAAVSVGIAVPLPWPMPPAEARRVLGSLPVKATLVSSARASSMPELAHPGSPTILFSPGSSGRMSDFHLDGRSFGTPTPETSPYEDDIALILHSSGSTSRPKLVPRTHRAIVSTCRNLIDARAITEADRCLSTAKGVHSQGINTLTVPIYAGASQIILPDLALDALPGWLHAHRPTYISTTPALLRLLAADDAARDALRHAPLRCIHSTASPISTAEIDEFEATFGVPVLSGYGMSEATGIAGERLGWPRVAGAIGTPWCDVRILPESDSEGNAGEITVRGPRVFPGYLDDPEANAAAFLPGGWFRTGDLGYLDDGGHLHLTGRLSEVINRGGEKIAPGEIDDALISHPAVVEAAAFGVPHLRLGEDVVAAVVLRPGASASARELRSWMLDRLAPFKAPRRIWFVDALPHTATGKVQRAELARRWIDLQA